jgi:hypothetical protein
MSEQAVAEQGNQSFQSWSDAATVPHSRSPGTTDQDGLVSIETPFSTNRRYVSSLLGLDDPVEGEFLPTEH